MENKLIFERIPISKEAKDLMDSFDYDYINNISRTLIDSLNKKRDESIIKRLNYCGFTFENETQFHEFIKTRCLLEKHPDEFNRLLVDGICIAEWNDKINIDFNGSTINATMG